MVQKQKIIIYTDGAAIGNPGPGGYGAVLMFGPHRREISEGFRLTTNNRMELLAVIKALEMIKSENHDIAIYSDSKYVCDAVLQGWLFGWKKKAWKNVKNVDLWQMFLTQYQRLKPQFHWVKGHAGIPENERCDVLATTAAAGNNLSIDLAYERSKNTDNKLL